MAWRIGAKFLVRSLRLWAQWLDRRTLGGIPGRSLLEAHLRWWHAMDSHADDVTFVVQDWPKFFGAITSSLS